MVIHIHGVTNCSAGEATCAVGILPHCDIQGLVDTAVSNSLRRHILRRLRVALSNVARYAQAATFEDRAARC